MTKLPQDQPENVPSAGPLGKIPKPLLVLSLVAVLGFAGFAVWKFTSNIVDDSTDVFDDDSKKTVLKESGKNASQKTPNTSVVEKGSTGNDSDLSNGNFSKSRMIEMAIARCEQMESLWDHHKVSSSQGENTQSLRIDVKVQKEEDLYKKNAEELERNRRDYGADHLFTLQSEIRRAVILERMGQSDDQELIQTARKWETVAADLKKADLTGNGKSSSKLLSDMFHALDVRRVCRFVHDTGEVLAMLLWAHGDHAEASRIVRDITSIDRRLPFSLFDASVSVHKLLTLARLCVSQNEFAEAKEIISVAKSMAATQRSVSIVSEAHSRAMCLLEESRLSLAEHDYTAAAELARQADDVLNKNEKVMETPQNEALRADALEQMARALSSSPAKLSAAIENQEKCLALRKKAFGKMGLYCASTSLDLARMLRLNLQNSGDPISEKSEEAVRSFELLNQIIAICQRNQKADSEVLRADRNPKLVLSQAYYELAMLQASCGKFAEAKTAIQQACDIVLNFSEPLIIPYKVTDLDALACFELRENKVDAARATVLKASKFLNSYVADVLPQLSLSEQIAFSSNIERHMNGLLAVCRDDASISDIYGEMMRWKGYLIEQFRLRADVIKQKGNAQMKALLNSHSQLSSKILNKYVESAQSGEAPEVAGASQKQKEEIERQINSKLRGKQSESLAITPRSLQVVLKPNEALVDLYAFASSPWAKESHYAAVIVGKNSLRWLDLGPTKIIDTAVNAWRSFDGLRSDIFPANSNSSECIGPWNDLTKLLYLPLSKVIPVNVNSLWVADESQLSRLPWSVLMSNYGGTREFQVSQIDSPRELVNLQNAENASRRSEILIVGGIDYSKHNPPAPPLKHSLGELQEIKSVMQTAQYKCMIQSDFLPSERPTRKNIIDSLGKCQLAHLVTHGFFNDTSNNVDDVLSLPTRNPLIESGLLISRGTAIKEEENGFLTAEDLLDANLQGCRLVTLSACETARGREVSSQGVMGLRSALMGAGADSVMLSLWPVPDKPTSELMKSFYKRILAGDPPVQALKSAQATVRSNPKWQAPYYWAAWIIVGDGRKRLSK
jgi:hypothetical protein